MYIDPRAVRLAKTTVTWESYPERERSGAGTERERSGSGGEVHATLPHPSYLIYLTPPATSRSPAQFHTY